MPVFTKAKAPGRRTQGAFRTTNPDGTGQYWTSRETLSYLPTLLKSYPPTDEGRRRWRQQLTLPVLRSKFFRGGGRDMDQVLIQALTDDQAAPKNVQLGRKTRRAAL